MTTIYEIENRLSYFIDRVNDGDTDFTAKEMAEFLEIRALLDEIMQDGAKAQADLTELEAKHAKEFAKIERRTRTTNILVSKKSTDVLKQIKQDIPEVNSYEDALDYLISHYYK